MTPHERSAEQRKQIWSGCQTILGWAGLIALAAFFYYVAGLLPKSVSGGNDVVVFLNQGVMQNNIFGCALFGSVFFFLLLAATKSSRGIVVVCTIFIAVAGLLVWGLYSRVAAIAFHDGVVELRYVWPRPSVQLKANEIIAADYEQGPSSSDDSALEYTLHLRTQRRHYTSFGDTSLDDMQQTLRRIKEMQGR